MVLDTHKVVENILQKHEQTRVLFGDKASKGKKGMWVCKDILPDGTVCGQTYSGSRKPNGIHWKDGHVCHPVEE